MLPTISVARNESGPFVELWIRNKLFYLHYSSLKMVHDTNIYSFILLYLLIYILILRIVFRCNDKVPQSILYTSTCCS